MFKLSQNLTKFLRFIANFVIDNVALKKPWLYLSLSCYAIMWLLVWSGNPLLPIQFLARYGWAWHHVPEILSSVFFGMWVGSFGFLSCDGFNIRDALPLLILIALSALTPTHFWIFWLILIIVSIPSFFGYFAIRVYGIRKTRSEAYKLIGIEK